MLVLDLVTSSLRDATVLSETQDPSSEQGEDAVTRLNELMASLEEDGIGLGYNPKASTADTLSLPPGHVISIRALLTSTLCESYGLPVPPMVAAIAASGYQRLLRQAIYANARETRTDNAPSGSAQYGSYDITRGY